MPRSYDEYGNPRFIEDLGIGCYRLLPYIEDGEEDYDDEQTEEVDGEEDTYDFIENSKG